MACSLRLYVYREYLPLTEDILKLGARIFAVPASTSPSDGSLAESSSRSRSSADLRLRWPNAMRPAQRGRFKGARGVQVALC